MEGTQVTDIEKKIDYPQFKTGVSISNKGKNITGIISDNIKGVKLNESEMAVTISKLIEDEAEAITGYSAVLDNSNLLPEDLEQIKEFISDEKNHLEKLQEILKHYDGSIEPNVD